LNKITIEINGEKVEVTPGKMLIEITDQLNIPVPRFCYHNKLPIAANCRMCLIEVEKAPKPLPACATPVTDGMKVWTKSPLSVSAQKSALEFLLINHPLDCPICDQGGECELQDLSMGYGSGFSNFSEVKRVVVDKNLGPLIKTDMTRCIHCTRCVRFGQDIAGFRELGATNRGEHMEIGTFIEKNVESEVSGNVIDLCPVGALTSKPFAYKARSWELSQVASVSPHDCVGSNIYVHTRRNKVMRVVPRENEAINEIWLADRDRFSYESMYSKDRLILPKIKTKDGWQETSWDAALQFVADKLQQVKNEQGAEQIGALVSPSATCEEMYLLQKITRGLGSSNIDHRLRQLDFSDENYFPLFPNLGGSFTELKQAEHVLLIGSNIHKEQPLIGLHLRKNSLHGGKISIINPLDFTINFTTRHKIIPDAGDLLTPLAGIAQYVLQQSKVNNISLDIIEKFKNLLAKYTPTVEQELIAKEILATANGHIVLGALAINHPQAAKINSLCNFISQITGHKFGMLTEGGNAAGAWVTGCVPHRFGEGKNVNKMLTDNLSAYILLGIEPNLDSCFGDQAVACLNKAELVIALTAFESSSIAACADVMLPIATWLETPGTYINCTGEWQSVSASVIPEDNIRPAWKVLRVLANLLDLDNFAYMSNQDVLIEIKSTLQLGEDLPKFSQYIPDNLENNANGLFRVASTPIYAVDMFVRRAKALAATKDAISAEIAMISQQQADKLGSDITRLAIETKQGKITNQIKVTVQVPENTIWLNQGLDSTSKLGVLDSRIEAKRI
jgi:NADH-quinone oxidoreductase subunit G